MEHGKKRLELALLPAPDHIDASKNPYELLNDLVNVAPLGDLITTTTPSTSPPPTCLLQVPEKCPNPNWFSECWTFQFSVQEVVDLQITFPLPVMLSEAQILFGGDKAEWPSEVTLEVCDNGNDKGNTSTPSEPFTLFPFQGLPPGAWISIQLQEPQMVWKAVLRIHKPKNSSGSINLYRIRLLEQSDVDMTGEDFNLDNFIKRVSECKVQIPDMLKYCQSFSTNPGCPRTLLERASAILRHFEVKEPVKVEDEKPVVEEKRLMDMPVMKELLACWKPHPQIDAILNATQSHDSGLKLIFEQFQPQAQTSSGISADTIAAFLHFFSLPRYREILLGDMFNDRMDCIIRLALGVTKGMKGVDIKALDSLPYEALNWLLEIHPSTTAQGRNLRRRMMEVKAIHFVLEHCHGLTHEESRVPVTPSSSPGFWTKLFGYGSDSSDSVWAKGTGYGGGFFSTFYDDSSTCKDVDRAQERNKSKEDGVICLLNVLANFVNDLQEVGNGQVKLLAEVNELLKKSSLITVLSSYLRNDSVLDIAGHVPLYKVVFQLLSSIASTPKLWALLISSEGESVILGLLNKLKNAVTTYSRILEVSKNQDSEFIQLLQDIQIITAQVEGAVAENLNLQKAKGPQKMETESASHSAPKKTLEERYVDEMKKLQFAFIKMIGDNETFLVPYHYAKEARKSGAASGPRIHARFKRLAQESATLSTSLPLSYGSSIFLRCDNDRLDVIKVLITGPAGTPYSNGCFEFDVHFPLDYPNSPPMVNFQTTGGNRVQFNPNLYADGKLCLSILNTYVGSPDERWNPKSSCLLPVLVAIQSLILVDQPYWNEPIHHTIFGGGVEQAQEYNAKIRRYTLYYAIMKQMKNKTTSDHHASKRYEVIQRHFWMKREEILAQCEEWKLILDEKDVRNRDCFEQTVATIKSNLMSMTPPEGLEDIKFK